VIDGAAALAALSALGDPGRSAAAAAYHKAARPYLGVPVPAITALCRVWREAAGLEARVALAATLWDSNIHEARIAAAKLLTQARLRPDAPAWAEILRWVPMFDAWAIADHAADAGARRLEADPARLDALEGWVADPNRWVRRAALTFTLPWAKLNHPDAEDRARRELILGWAAVLAPDRDWFVQKAVAWWLRTLAKRDPDRVRDFLAGPGRDLRAFARREAARLADPEPPS
jgi:3-methyladenine DNA glycosylase AlkD